MVGNTYSHGLRDLLRCVAIALVIIGSAYMPSSPAHAQSYSPEREMARSAEKLARTRAILADQQSRGDIGQRVPLPVEDASSGGVVWKMLQGFAFCLVAFCAAIACMRRFGGKRFSNIGGRRVRVVERVSISGKSWVALVEVDGREILVSGGAERTTLMNLVEREFDPVLDPELLSRNEDSILPQQVAV